MSDKIMALSANAKWVLEDPFRLLGLQLSQSPWRGSDHRISVQLDVDAAGATMRLPFSKSKLAAAPVPMIITKETYFMASLMLHEWKKFRQEESKEPDSDELNSEMSFERRCRDAICIAFEREGTVQDDEHSSLEFKSWQSSHQELARRMKLPTDANRSRILQNANRTLRDLENRQLIVDPPFAGMEGPIILLGLIPLKFSNRTDEGQDVIREIDISAALWDFTYKRRRSGVEWSGISQ